jgi:hypothetical protein
MWGSDSPFTTAHGLNIGDGKEQTAVIVATLGANDVTYAAGLCDSSTAGGYSDWFLPSNAEMIEMGKYVTSLTFTDFYWISLDAASGQAGALKPGDAGSMVPTAKSSRQRVRAARQF